MSNIEIEEQDGQLVYVSNGARHKFPYGSMMEQDKEQALNDFAHTAQLSTEGTVTLPDGSTYVAPEPEEPAAE